VIVMAGLNAGTILLLALWTLWLLAALPLLGRGGAGFGLLAVFVPLALVLAFTTDITWRSYLITWLIAHVLLAAMAAYEDRRQIGMAAVSLAGVLWLWGQGGWQYGRYLLTGMLIVCAIAALIGLGAGSCWVLVARPARKQADDSARRAYAADQRAGNAERSLARAYAQLAAERQQREADAGQVEGLEQRRQAEQERHEQDRRAWERNRARFLRALREARRDHDLDSGAGSAAEQPDGAENDSAEPVTAGEVTVVRLRVSYIIDERQVEVNALGGQDRLTAADADRIRLLIERDVTVVPREQAGNVDDVLEKGRQAQQDATLGDRFIDAASEYAAGRIGDKASEVITQRWTTQDVAGLGAVAGALGRSDEWMHEMVGKPLEGAAGRLGLDGPGAAAIGGIGSNMLLAPVSREIQGVVRFCEIVGIGIGLAAGLHPLAIACTKSFLRAQFNERLGDAVKEAARNAFCDRDVVTTTRDYDPATARRPAGRIPRADRGSRIREPGAPDRVHPDTTRDPRDPAGGRSGRLIRRDYSSRPVTRDPLDRSDQRATRNPRDDPGTGRAGR
jgi:hypothetical protein